MTAQRPTCPAPRSRVVDLYFLEHRAKLLDIAAFLDRVDRAADDLGGKEDFRLAAMRAAIGVLEGGGPERARRVQEVLSDPTDAPIAKAPMQGAFGAWPQGPNTGAGKGRS